MSSICLIVSLATLSVAVAATCAPDDNGTCAAPTSALEPGVLLTGTAEDTSLLQASRRGLTATEKRPRLAIPGLGSLVGNKIPGGAFEFLNIPYAVPPGRFQKARLNSSWPHVLNATSPGHNCIQTTKRKDTISEDCLNLNVYTPSSACGGKGDLLPVWFWIYGGGLVGGSNLDYNGSELSSTQHIVVVTINYRLGALSWLAVGDEESSGAMNGWHDTLVALKWVKSHIKAFGGDPEQLYIGGESGGSLLTCQHLYSPLTAAVGIKGVTMESGACNGPWGPNGMKSSFSQSLEWMKYALGSHFTRPQLVKKALNASVKLYESKKPYGNDCCGPSAVDGEFFTKRPMDSKFAVQPKIRVMLGSNSLDDLAPLYGTGPTSKHDLRQTLLNEGLEENASDVIKFYTQTPGLAKISEPNVSKWKLLYWQIHRDASNTCPTLWNAQKLSKHGATDVYLYFEDFKKPKKNLHGSELPLFWASGYSGGGHFNVTDIVDFQAMLRNFLYGAEPSTMWTSFAANPKQQNYLWLKRKLKLESGYDWAGCEFWRQFYEGPQKLRQQFVKFGWGR